MGTFDRALFDALVSVGVPADRNGLHAQVLATRHDVAESKSDLTRWVLAALTAQTALLVGAMKLL